jgi:SAM-dependent methyltransferase
MDSSTRIDRPGDSRLDGPADPAERGSLRIPRVPPGSPALPSEPCPVCRGHLTDPLQHVTPYDYWQCAGCWAIFVAPGQRPSAHEEASHYALHDNRVDDPGFRRFLSRLAAPLLQRLPPGSHGLDFGCGPGPALAHMLREAGQRVTLYDPLFHPDDGALDGRYDFIVLSEVAEHLHDPAGVFERLFGLLRPRGILAVMTGFPPAAGRFASWHYRRDPTHVVFYRPATLRQLARRFDADCEIPCANVALMVQRG